MVIVSARAALDPRRMGSPGVVTAVVALELVIPGFVPDARLSLNGRNRTHWATVRVLREAAGVELDKLALALGPLPAFDRARIRVEFVFPVQRRRDPDGLAGLAKPLLDRLVAYGVLVDDDAAHVELTVTAAVEPGVTETRIHVADAAG